MRTTFLLLLIFILPIIIFSQSEISSLDCAFDSMHRSKLNSDPSYQKNVVKGESEWYKSQTSDQVEQSTAPITLPVVFHIIHQNGSENLSDPQVINALDHLNQSFANTGYYNPNTGVNTEIQFCLAQRDPDGNTTDGITRTSSPLTNLDADIDDGNLKNLSRWSPTSYINIWVVKEICRGGSCSVAGYAYLPAAHGRSYDGIVLEAGYVGSSQAKTTVLTHEMGHYLGLYHTFQGGCENNDCLQDGDKICDTPPDNTTSYTACDGSMNSCTSDEDDPSVNNPFRSLALGGQGDQDDLFENYMDYSKLNCYDQFTSDQKDRMHYIINSTRSSLLNSLSCLTPCQNEVTARITNSILEFELGTTINLNNASTNASRYKWYVNDTLFSSDVEPSYTINQEGYYTIVLEAISGDTTRCRNDYDTIQVIVTCPTIASFDINTEDLSVNAQNSSQNHNSSHWSLRDQNGQELFSSNTEDFTYELTEAGWHQLCLKVEGDECIDNRCSYFFLQGEKSKSKCTDIKNKVFLNARYNDIKVIKSQDGSIYLTGVRDNEYFISKLTENGVELWSKMLPHHPVSSGTRRLYSVYEDSDGYVLVTGVIGKSDGILIKFDPFNLNTIWSTLIENTRTLSYNTIESNDDLNYVLSGQNHGCDEATLLLVNKTSGNINAHYGYGLGECTTFINGIKDGASVITTGRYSLGFGFDTYRPGVTKLDFSGNIIWSYTYLKESSSSARLYSNEICKAPNGFLLVGHGDLNGTNPSNSKGFIFKINNDGEIQWSKFHDIKNAKFQRYRQVFPHSSGFYILGEFTNQTNNTSDAVIANVNHTGDIIWARSIDYEMSNERVLQNTSGVLLANDTLLCIVPSDNQLIWVKIPPDGEFDANCNLISDITVEVNNISNYKSDHSPIKNQRNFATSTDNSLVENISLDKEFICGLPDISLRIDSIWCTSNDGFIAKTKIEVCNNGIAPFSGNIPISIYDNNPTKTDAQLVHKDTLTVDLEVDDCQTFAFPVLPRDKTSGTFFMVINDDNSITPTYDLNEDFPVTDIDECLFQNNLDSFSFNYTVKSLDLGPDISTCDNKPFTFNAGAGFDSYQWNDASTDSTLTAAISGTYWVTAIDECGVAYSDTVQLNYESPTQVELRSDTSLCLGDSITLSSTNSFSNYSWFPDEVFPCSSCPNVTIAPDSTITVILTVESDPGCFSSDSIRIEVERPFQVIDTVNLCKGDSINYLGHSITDSGEYSIVIGQCDTIVNLHAQYKKVPSKEIDLGQDIFSCDDTTVTFIAPSGFDSYQWNTNSSDSMITTSVEGEYWVLAIDECGATYSDTVQLKYNNAPPIDLESDKTICSGELLWLNAPSGYANYNWSPSELFECSNCQNTSITPDSTLIVNLLVQTDSGCVSTDSLFIEVHHPKQLYDTVDICKGDSIIYQNQTIDKSGIYEFQYGVHCDTTLFLIVNEIDISPVINELDLSILQRLQNLSGNQYDIDLDLNREDWNVVWSPSDNFTCDTCLSTSILPFEGDKMLSLKLTHSSGCVYFKVFPVNWIEQSTVYIPNIFTPNGDGVNDTWRVTPAPAVDRIVNAKIYSRWGGLIKEWRNVKQIEWDGKVKGKYLNPGVFIYVLTYATIDGEEHTRKGDFTLMR